MLVASAADGCERQPACRGHEPHLQRDTPVNSEEPVIHVVLPSDLQGAGDIESGPSLAGRVTVVEVATYLEEGVPDPATEAFDRGLGRVRQVALAYSVATHQYVAPITRERLGSMTLYTTRTLSPPYDWSGVSMLMLHMNDVIRSTPSDLDEETTKVMMDLVSGQVASHPVAPYLELTAESRRAFEREGDYRSAILHLHTAGEVLLDSVLAALLWEDSVSAEVAAASFDGTLSSRIKQKYRASLKGDWSLRGSGALAEWARAVSHLRNRCAHSAYVPTVAEVQQAQAAHIAMRDYVADRLIAVEHQYPKTAALHTNRATTMSNIQETVRDFSTWRDTLMAHRTARRTDPLSL